MKHVEPRRCAPFHSRYSLDPFVVKTTVYAKEVFASGDARLTGFLQVPNCEAPHCCIYLFYFFFYLKHSLSSVISERPDYLNRGKFITPHTPLPGCFSVCQAAR